MLARVTSSELFQTLETYYDAAPRPQATTEEVGPFTLFVRRDQSGWPYYARPRLGLDVSVTRADVEQVRERQRELGVPENVEWVHETTPTLLDAARDAGLAVRECPLLVLPDGIDPSASALPEGTRVVMLSGDSPEIGEVSAAVSAGFSGSDELRDRAPGPQPRLLREGLMAMAGAFDDRGAVGGGSHSARGTTTELAGIAVLPRARKQGVGAALTHALVVDARRRGVQTIFLSAQDDAVARVYERVGFVRVGTACIAEAADG